MDNQNNRINPFVNNEGFSAENNLVDILGNNDDNEGDQVISQVKLSTYLDTHELSDKLYLAKSKLSILSLNAQSIMAKFDEFQIAIDQINSTGQEISIICIQESWLSSECNVQLFKLHSYQLVSKGKYCSNHGGLLIYVHNDFLWEPLDIRESTTGWENLFIKIRHKSLGSKPYIIGNVYRLPKELLPEFHTFMDEFAETLETLQVNRNAIYLCGDFNIDLLKINTKIHYNTFYNNLIAAGYLPRISLPTRVTNYSATLLDNIFSTEFGNNDSGVIVNNISDHQMIYTYSTLQERAASTSHKKHIEIETNNRQALELFITKLRNCNIVDKLNVDVNADPNSNFECFMKHFMELKQQCLPKKKVRFNRKKHKGNAWLTAGILKSINSKNILYKKLMQTPADSPNYPDLSLNFKSYKNIIRRTIMHAKRTYYKTVFNSYSTNLKKTWQTINESLNRRKKKQDFPQEFKLANGNLISDPKQIADAFNDFFVNIGDTGPLNANPIADFEQYMPAKPNCNLKFQSVTVDNVSRIIDSLKPKTSSGVDCISNKLIKYVKNVIMEPLTVIINQMLKVGIFPDSLKISKVIPIYKKSDNTIFSNYRPISLLPSISKIFEKIILEQITTYLDTNNLIHKHQYGFRKNHSTEYAALHIVNYLNYELDRNRTPTNVYLDLSKAFDTLSHNILLRKLKHYVVYVCTLDASKAFDRVNLLTLFKKLFERNMCPLFLRFLIHSYCNQKMRIKWNAAISDSFDTSNGVKQGGVLSPLLFNVYLDELILLLREQGVGCHMNGMFVGAFCYADDVTLLAPTGMALNAMLDTCTRFADAHDLSFNSSKTKCMFIDRSCLQLHSDVRFMGRSVEFVNSVDLLGVPLYADLKVNHIHRNVQKFYCKVNSVLFDFKDIPSDVKSKLMDTYCLDLYGSQLWNYSKNDVNAFYIAWRKVVRRIWKIPSTTHCNLLPAINKSLPIEFLMEKRCAKFIWSCFNCHNLIVRNISMAAKISSFSDFGDNYRYLSYKYGIGIHVWHLPLCKLYKCFDVFLLNHHKTIANGVFIRDLCLLRENDIVDDDQDLTSTELTYMIDFLCTS